MEQVFPSYDPGGVGGSAMVIDAWSGGVYDPIGRRMLLWGGGHSDYYGNEVYAFSIESLSWSRLTEPSVPKLNAESNNDGTPTSRHTYNGLAFIAHANRFFGRGGSRAGDGWEVKWTWTFDPNAQAWQHMSTSGSSPGGGLGNAAVYDPASKKVFFGCNDPDRGLYSYDFEQNRWTKHNSDEFYYQTLALDSKRGLLVAVGEDKVFAYDIKNSNYSKQTWNTTGSNEIRNASNPGLTYDSKDDKIVAWSGSSVYFLDTETKTWTKKNPSGSPGGTSTGIFGRWRYLSLENVFIAISSSEKNVHFYKNTAGAGSFSTPVELVSFTAHPFANSVVVEWVTATETNNYGFDVERRMGDEPFQKIGFVFGRGNSTEYQTYRFIDSTSLSPADYTYRLKQVDNDGSYEYSTEINLSVQVPEGFQLMQNYPNPFNPTTQIGFQLPRNCKVTLAIFDLSGRVVNTAIREEDREAGYHEVEFDGSGVSAGVYFYQLIADSRTVATEKMVLIK
jgi:hypothetical protein